MNRPDWASGPEWEGWVPFRDDCGPQMTLIFDDAAEDSMNVYVYGNGELEIWDASNSRVRVKAPDADAARRLAEAIMKEVQP